MTVWAHEPFVGNPLLPSGPAGPHAAMSGPVEEEFNYRLPFELDLGRAAIIAEALREYGYQLCTADTVTAELARPDSERTDIGRFAADALARAGWRP